MKAKHEDAVQQAISNSYSAQRRESLPLASVQESIYSTLLPVVCMPKFVWWAPSNYTDTEERAAAKEVDYGSSS